VSIKSNFINHITQLQNKICAELEQCDGAASFKEDQWLRPGGGGGNSRIISKGNVFEKGGVNISEVYGEVTDTMKSQLKIDGDYFFATGLSLVLHPVNPFVPTIHANFRYFELYDGGKNVIDSWFGGGTDLTPYYLFEEDAIHFHKTLKECCDNYNVDFYSLFKKECDNYFVNKHRNNEARGIGGIFFDYLRQNEQQTADFFLDFCIACSNAFLPAYLPIMQKRRDTGYNAKHKYWQEIRRGRYTEFNLVHDRGTLFGLKTNGRTESILMSLPPTVRFDYDYKPAPESEEEKMLQVCLTPKKWV
jgi:coproporphyrinogen III oxidase